MNQIQCNLWFGLDEQLCRNQTIAFRTGIAYENTHLRVGYFSNTTTILRGHTHRMLAFFKRSTIIDGNLMYTTCQGQFGFLVFQLNRYLCYTNGALGAFLYNPSIV